MPRTRRREGAAPPPPGGSTLAGATPRRIRENLPRPTPAAGLTGTPAAPRVASPSRRRNPFGSLRRFEPRFIADIVSELRKVTWPTFTETRYLTVVVAVVALFVGAILGSVDLFFGWAVEKLFF